MIWRKRSRWLCPPAKLGLIDAFANRLGRTAIDAAANDGRSRANAKRSSKSGARHSATMRLVIMKLITGAFRVGVSKRLVTRAVAQHPA